MDEASVRAERPLAAYLVISHTLPRQVLRLMSLLRRASPRALLLGPPARRPPSPRARRRTARATRAAARDAQRDVGRRTRAPLALRLGVRVLPRRRLAHPLARRRRGRRAVRRRPARRARLLHAHAPPQRVVRTDRPRQRR